MFVVHCVIVCSNVLHSITCGPNCFVFHSHIQDNQGLSAPLPALQINPTLAKKKKMPALRVVSVMLGRLPLYSAYNHNFRDKLW